MSKYSDKKERRARLAASAGFDTVEALPTMAEINLALAEPPPEEEEPKYTSAQVKESLKTATDKIARLGQRIADLNAKLAVKNEERTRIVRNIENNHALQVAKLKAENTELRRLLDLANIRCKVQAEHITNLLSRLTKLNQKEVNQNEND